MAATQFIDLPAFPTSSCTWRCPQLLGSTASQACRNNRGGASGRSRDTGSTSSSFWSLLPDHPALHAGRASALRGSKGQKRTGHWVRGVKKQLAFGHRTAVAIIKRRSAPLVPSPTTFRSHLPPCSAVLVQSARRGVLECTDWNPLPLNKRRESGSAGSTADSQPCAGRGSPIGSKLGFN